MLQCKDASVPSHAGTEEPDVRIELVLPDDGVFPAELLARAYTSRLPRLSGEFFSKAVPERVQAGNGHAVEEEELHVFAECCGRDERVHKGGLACAGCAGDARASPSSVVSDLGRDAAMVSCSLSRPRTLMTTRGDRRVDGGCTQVRRDSLDIRSEAASTCTGDDAELTRVGGGGRGEVGRAG